MAYYVMEPNYELFIKNLSYGRLQRFGEQKSEIFFIFSIWNLFISFLQIFNIYIKRAAEIFGVTHTREIYEKAIEALPDEHARYGTLFHFEMKMCLIGNVFWWYKI